MATKAVLVRPKEHETVRNFYSEICTVLSKSEDLLTEFAVILYGERIIDVHTKNTAIRTKGYGGADTLMSRVEMKVQQCGDCLCQVLQIMKGLDCLKIIASKMILKGRFDCDIFHGSDYNTVVQKAKALKSSFEGLLLFVHSIIGNVNISILKLKFNWYISSELLNTRMVQKHLDNLQKLDAPDAVLNFLINRHFVGYLNYELLEVIQKTALNDEFSTKLQQYRNDHDDFLKCTGFNTLIDVFQNKPELRPVSAIGLPKFILQLDSPWEGRSVYSWKELLDKQFNWPSTVHVTSITRNCIIIEYSVLPPFVPAIFHDLTNTLVLSVLKSQGVTVKLTSELIEVANQNKISVLSALDSAPKSDLINRPVTFRHLKNSYPILTETKEDYEVSIPEEKVADEQEKVFSTTEKQKLSLQKDELLREQAHETRKIQLKNDVQLPLKIEHYRKKFEALLVYEEEEHSNLLAKKCDGKYCLTLFNNSDSKLFGQEYPIYAFLKMSPESVLYAVQRAKEVRILCNSSWIKGHLLKYNYKHLSDSLYIGIKDISLKSICGVTTTQVDTKFTFNTSYFNQLRQAINKIPVNVIRRIIPSDCDFKGVSYNLNVKIPLSAYDINKIDESQQHALQRILAGESSAPVIISAPFGCGKTQLLSAASECMMKKSRKKKRPCRILLCFHYQASAECFMKKYFIRMCEDKKNPWQVEAACVVSQSNIQDRNIAQYVIEYKCFETNVERYLSESYLVIVTTYLTALRMCECVRAGFFNYILIDEGAQAREPECIAPLCMADQNTRIAIVGDKKQNGPKHFVLGTITKKEGLGTSLLERLQCSYNTIGGAAKLYALEELNINYICAPGITGLLSNLFYGSSVQSSGHIKVLGCPYKFICSSLEEKLQSPSYSEVEASLIIQEVKKLQSSQDVFPDDICIMSPSYMQIQVIRKLMKSFITDANMIQIQLLTSYQMQGKEFKYIFISSVEAINKTGEVYEPLKSLCTSAVFNTCISRAQSLVVAIGNPFRLTKCEGLIGQKSWSEFIRKCKETKSYDDVSFKTLTTEQSTNVEYHSKSASQVKIDAGIAADQVCTTVNTNNGQEKKPMKVKKRHRKKQLEERMLSEDYEEAYPTIQEGNQRIGTKEISKPTFSDADYILHTHLELDMDVLKSELTVKNYKIKFHQLLCREEEEHKKILNERCDGIFTVRIKQPEQNDIQSKESYVRYGSIIAGTGNDLDDDKMSYASHSSEGVIILHLYDEFNHLVVVEADVTKYDYEDKKIWIGFDQKNFTILLKNFKKLRKQGTKFEDVFIKFLLKYSYFDLLHDAVDNISEEIIHKIMPNSASDFTHHSDVDIQKIQMPFSKLKEIIGLDIYKKNVSQTIPGSQMQALHKILSVGPCSSPVLLAGSFGTGKTRVLTRAAYQVLCNDKKAKVLLCAHHQASADSFINKYFGEIKEKDQKLKGVHIVRAIPEKDYTVKKNTKYEQYYRTFSRIQNMKIDETSLRLVVTTFSSSLRLLKILGRDHFTHIFIDEGAQTREPETIAPLCLANKNTKVVIAGDHKQVGPSILVLGSSAREYGLKCSLLERLQALYSNEDAPSTHCATLLTNFRSHHSLLSLASYLFYGSTLVTAAEAVFHLHPDSKHPLHFVCSGLDEFTEVNDSKDLLEAELILKVAEKYIKNWPIEWGNENSKDICVMAATACQRQLLKQIFERSEYEIEVLTVYEIQGREFQAVFLSTFEPIDKNGIPKNPTKSPCRQSVFNTALTRAKSLVVCVGKPFHLINAEAHPQMGNEVHFWKEYIRRCMITQTFHVPSDVSKSPDEMLEKLQSNVFQKVDVPYSSEDDTILNQMNKGISKFYNYEKCFQEIKKYQQSIKKEEKEHFHFKEEECKKDEIFKCELKVKNSRLAYAYPTEASIESITINGFDHRKGAFDGDIVTVCVFGSDQETGKKFGRVTAVIEPNHSTTCICTADPVYSTTFYPLDDRLPAIDNLSNISKKVIELMTNSNPYNESPKAFISVFEKNSLDLFESDHDKIHLPKIKELIPLDIASSLLFVVKILGWSHQRYRKPLGAVIEALPRTTNLLINEMILKITHNIDDHSVDCVKDFLESESTSILDIDPKYNCAFTIDPPDSVNLDDALSLVPLEEASNTFELAVLITDVAYHIQKDDELDKLARRHGTSIYPGKMGQSKSNHSILHMLPPNYSKANLSLLSGEVRPVLVVSARVQIEQDEIVSIQVEDPTHSFVKPVVNLDYRTAQILMNKINPREDLVKKAAKDFKSLTNLSLTQTLNWMFKIAMKLRIDRLDEASYIYQLSDPYDEENWQTHLLVEELMIWANTHVAEFMFKNSPDYTLLRHQLPPSCEDISKVCKMHQSTLEFSLQYSFLMREQEFNVQSSYLGITFSTIKTLKEAFCRNDRLKVARILANESNYPQLALLDSAMRVINHSAEYIFTGQKQVEDDSQNQFNHYSIRKKYTHFTSPIRRYIDIVVQRIVTSLITNDPELPFTSKELLSLCKIMNLKGRSAAKYARNIDRNELVASFEDEGMQKLPAYIASSLEKKSKFHLCFSSQLYNNLTYIEDTSFTLSQLNYHSKEQGFFIWHIISMSLSEPHHLLECPQVIDLKEKSDESNSDIIVCAFPLEKEKSSQRRMKRFYNATVKNELVKIDSETWKLAKKCIKNPNKVNVTSFMRQLQPLTPACISQPSNAPFQTQISVHDSPVICYSVKKKFEVGDMVNVWMGKSLSEPFPSPSVQLMEVAPSVRVCLEHMQNPSSCFSQTDLRLSSKSFFRTRKEYVDLWSNALLAEGCHDAVKTDQILIISKAALDWPGFIRGHNYLDKTYYIPTGCVHLEIPLKNLDMVDFFNVKVGNLVCVRYDKDKSVNSIFHFIVKEVDTGKSDQHKVKKMNIAMISAGEYGCRVPEKMRGILSRKPACTCNLQIIKMPDSIHRLYKRLQSFSYPDKTIDGIKNFGEWMELATCVALRNDVNALNETPQKSDVFMNIFKTDEHATNLWESGEKNAKLNKTQREAIETSLKHRFSLIQGPPGTGKSITGAHLAYVLARGNLESENGRCVLYCGPSNKAVDVVHDQFLKLNERLLGEKKLKLLRLYGRNCERQDYPDPLTKHLKSRFAKDSEKKDSICHLRFQGDALHHKIRKGTSAVKTIEEKLMKLKNDEIPLIEEREKYKNSIQEAEERELQQPCDVILCTCNETCSKRLLKALQRNTSLEKLPLIAQCIVDECGMANEPDTLAAISKCQHAVLIGDHKQLQPVVKYHSARKCGLGKSLFESYAQTDMASFTVLKTQYRMHSFICEGPSDIFYDGMLETDESVNRRDPLGNLDTFWLKPRCPITFFNLVGEESDMGEEPEHKGNIDPNSKCNPLEAEKTIHIIQRLLDKNLSTANIAVLTPYAAQKDKIFDKLINRNIRGIKVSTITESQGDEYDVVILSTVRSLPMSEIRDPRFVQPDRKWRRANLGFLTDFHQTNVGITRARYGLIIIGNRTLLEYDDNWNKLIRKYEENECYMDAV